jgi:hypothetical protein
MVPPRWARAGLAPCSRAQESQSVATEDGHASPAEVGGARGACEYGQWKMRQRRGY